MIIAKAGDIPEGKVVETAVAGIDIVPTIFSYAGIDLPWEMHGNDLKPLLENPDREWNYPALLTATGQKFGSDTDVIPTGEGAMHGQVPWYVMLRDGRFKYIRPLIPDLEELYDLTADPDELDNLAVKPEYRDTLERMRALAITELRKDGAGFVDAMPPVRMADD